MSNNHADSSQPGEGGKPDVEVNLLAFLSVLAKIGPGILSQIGLHLRLLAVEWEEERNRWLAMLLAIILGFACVLCMLIAVGALVITLTWQTEYRIWAIVGLIVGYGLLGAAAFLALRYWMKKGVNAFRGCRDELAADIGLIRSQL